jgi:hypothetical protein
MNLLTELANKYGTDKGTEKPNDGIIHADRLGFTEIYHNYMNNIRFDKLVILEIGVDSGRSLKMWYDYFPNSTIHGVDLFDKSQYNSDRVITHICDQSNRNQLLELMNKIGNVDIVIDDGSHVISHQLITLSVIFNFINTGGQYWIEDLHTSDNIWQGKSLYGYDMSFENGQSTVDVLERFIDSKVFESKHLHQSENDKLSNEIKEIKIFDMGQTMWGKNKLSLII